MSCIAVLNAGSSSIKFALYADGTGDELLFKGQVEKIGTAPRMKVSNDARTIVSDIDHFFRL